MKKLFSKSWIASKQPRKQRKYAKNAPLHIRAKLIGAHLSKELHEKHKKRSAQLRTGDKVKIIRGQNKGVVGKIEKISTKESQVFVTGVDNTKKDGNKVLIPIHPSNVIIEELQEDRRRKVLKNDKKSS